jgi:GTP-binding protein LepA
MHSSKKINFCIIAHIDHGKSTLSDRILEICGAKDPLLHEAQVLDNMELEKEMGITIKAQSVRLNYKQNILILNDTPGHVDFSNEVHRSLSACGTSVLVVDTTQGVQAQTLAHLYKAKELGHVIIPVLNKIDLPSANIEGCITELNEMQIDTTHIQYVSAKTGQGVPELLDTIVRLGSAAANNSHLPLQARIIDSNYDQYSGIVFLMRIFTGKVKVGDTVHTYHSKNKFLVKRLVFLTPQEVNVDSAESGDIVLLFTTTKDANTVPGDIIYDGKTQLIDELKSSILTKPIVFYTVYLEDTAMSERAAVILKKYQLNDAGFTFSIENNSLYGICFNCGFLGTLHCTVVKERLARDHGLRICTAAPAVEYHVYLKSGDACLVVNNHQQMPDDSDIERIEEPYARCTIFISKNSHVGEVLDLCAEKRAIGIQTSISSSKVIISCDMPLIEVITNLNDKLKSITSGYASLEYDVVGYKPTQLTKLIVCINGEALATNGMLVHSSQAKRVAAILVEKVSEVIERRQTEIVIQVVASTSQDNRGSKVLARANIKAYRKDVLAGCYGGHVDRKKKLLEKQKAGKARNADVKSTSTTLSNVQWSSAITKTQKQLEV